MVLTVSRTEPDRKISSPIAMSTPISPPKRAISSPIVTIPPITKAPLFSFNSQRLRMSLLLMLGLYCVVSMRLDLGMAIVCMVNSTAFVEFTPEDSVSLPANESINSSFARCSKKQSGDQLLVKGYNGDLLWSPQMQTLLMSATFYGSLLTITISGVIADHIGPKICMTFSCVTFAIGTLLTPMIASISYSSFFVARMLMGIGEGFCIPAMGSMASRWFPPEERSTMAAMYTSGNQVAASFSTFIASELCSSTFGWPSIFYLFEMILSFVYEKMLKLDEPELGGILGLLWVSLWQWIASDSPDANPMIKDNERQYLRQTIVRKKKNINIPWRSILTSRAVHANLITQFNFNFFATMLQSFLPTYFKDQLMVPLHQNGFYTAVPFVFQLVSKNICGVLADYIKSQHILSHTSTAKLFQTISNVGAAVSLLCLAYFPDCETPYLAALFLACYGFFFSAGICGFFTSMLSIAPHFSGTLVSLGMTSGSIANVAAPLWLSIVMIMRPPDQVWSLVFVSGAITNIFSLIVFLYYGSADIQPWALDTVDDAHMDKVDSPVKNRI